MAIVYAFKVGCTIQSLENYNTNCPCCYKASLVLQKYVSYTMIYVCAAILWSVPLPVIFTFICVCSWGTITTWVWDWKLSLYANHLICILFVSYSLSYSCCFVCVLVYLRLIGWIEREPLLHYLIHAHLTGFTSLIKFSYHILGLMPMILFGEFQLSLVNFNFLVLNSDATTMNILFYLG